LSMISRTLATILELFVLFMNIYKLGSQGHYSSGSQILMTFFKV
jgi:hypothetical protein